MDKKNTNTQDDRIRALFSGTEIKAGANLKFRIMQQIETESVLAGKKSKGKNIMPLIWNMLSVFGIMYALIAIVAAGVFLTGGRSALESVTFFVPVILITSVCGLFLMISILDDRRRSKNS
ncbi:MAG: hypothetical protein LBL07_15675 [Tannerella sp.]|jgi:hypothetical protein|nr:hypothetical protein [Tannerella sp.]